MSRPAPLRPARLFRHSALLFAGRLAGAGAGVLTLWQVTRALGPEDYARVSVGLSLAMLLSVLCTATVEAGSVRFMVRYRQEDDLPRLAGYVHFTRRVALWGGGLTVALALLLIPRVAPPALAPVLVWAALTAPVLGMIRMQAGHLMGSGRALAAALPRTCLRPLLFCAGISLGLGLLPAPQPAHVLMILAATALGVLALQWGLLRPLRAELRQEPERHDARGDWLRTGMILGANVLFIEYATAVAVLAASFVLPPTDLARFDVALRLVGFLRFGQVAGHQVLMPALSQAIAAGDHASGARLLRQAALFRLLVCVLGALAMVLIAPLLLGAFGDGFAGAEPLVLILLAEPVLMTVFGPGAALVSLSRNPAPMLKVLALTLAVLIPLTLIAGHLWGATGAALAYLGARSLWDIRLARIARHGTGLSPTLAILWRRASHG